MNALSSCSDTTLFFFDGDVVERRQGAGGSGGAGKGDHEPLHELAKLPQVRKRGYGMKIYRL